MEAGIRPAPLGRRPGQFSERKDGGVVTHRLQLLAFEFHVDRFDR